MDDLVTFVSPGRWLGHPTIVRDDTASTNDDARALAQQGCPDGTIALADTQSAGRGRRGRVWSSPPGDNLYLSVVLRPDVALHQAPALALVAGLAVAEAVETFTRGVPVDVKWPNDVRVRGKKLAGVLIEATVKGTSLAWVVVGIGVNVRGESPPPGLESIATTLRQVRGEDVGRAEVLRALVKSLEARLEAHARSGFSALREAIEARCETLGQRVTIEGLSGLATGLDDDGALRVLLDDGVTVSVRTGEVE